MELRKRLQALRREALTLWIAARDPRTPLLAEFRTRATALAQQPVSRKAAAVVIGLWIAAALFAGWLLLR